MDLSNVNTNGRDKGLDARIAHLCKMQSQGGGRNAVMATRQLIPKKKFIEGECYIQIMPAILALPFNPMDLADESFNMERRFLFKGMSAYAGVKLLKELMRADAELADYTAKFLGISVEMLGLDSEDISDEVLRVFKRYRTVDITSYPVQKMKFSDPAFKFGRVFRIPVELDSNGDVVETDKDLPLSIKLFQMETALIAAQNKLRNQAYESGELSDRSQQEIDNMNKAAWKNRLISNPYQYGVVRSVIIITDREFMPTPESTTSMKNASNYFTFEQYTGINSKFLKEEIEDRAGGTKDRYFDFFAIRVECKTKQNPNETLLEVVSRTTRALCSSDEEFTRALPDFEAKYRAYRDEASFWKPEIMEKSVRNFQLVDEDLILRRMQDDISHYKAVLNTKEIAEQYGALITRIDSALGSELLMLNETGDTKAIGLTQADLAEAPKDSAPNTSITESIGDDLSQEDLDALGSLLADTPM